MRRLTRTSVFAAARGTTVAALIGATLALGTLHDALVYAPNGAEVDHGSTASTATVPKQR
jgi:hypothetical protein